ncbi:hypothetical protein CN488_04555 [Bacillus anthracis]|nr:hypothetical protein CN488_04555 [Bacillus anthracis]
MSNNGRDMRYTLVQWEGAQENAERLAAQILMSEEYTSVDPMHPLGGPDGKKDLKCIKDKIIYVVACYFPRGQQTFNVIQKKFLDDLKGVTINNADGFIFVTNQEIKISERTQLKALADHPIEIFHLERIINILNKPQHAGTRRKYLDLDLSKEEMLAFFAQYEQTMVNVDKMMKVINEMSELYKKKQDEPNSNEDEPNLNEGEPNLNKGEPNLNRNKPTVAAPRRLRRGDVFFADLGNSMEYEMGGIRPVIIVSNSINNKIAPFITIVPISIQISPAKLPTQVRLGKSINPNKDTIALAEQIRTIGKQRIIKKITTLDQEVMRKINDAIRVQMELMEF